LGFGLSDKPDSADYTPQAHARRLKAFIKALNLKDVTIITQDYGGPISMDYAVHHPDNVRRIIVANSWMWSLPRMEQGGKIFNNALGKWLYLQYGFSPKVLIPQSFSDKKKLSPAVHAQYLAPLDTPTNRIATFGLVQALDGNRGWYNALQKNALLSTGINSTIFRPLNDRNFLIFQGSIDVNGIFPSLSNINSKAVTLSATGIYGWKKSESDMIGVGIARTYRAGRLIYVPVLLWNKTFNDRWGMELLLPAKGFVRYNFSTSSMLQLGFELEGNQFYSNLPQSKNGAVYIQRGEFKPRIMWDKKLTGFLWLNVQAGLRYNYRFDVMDKYDGKDDTERFFAPTLGNPLYLNFSLNFVSP
jgi:pimeloyl-ACP methyl ester carboxylesterase